MSHRFRMILAGVGLLSLGAAALAQTAPAPAPAGARHMAPPANRAELKTRLEQRFDALDANRDGTVTPEERRAKRAQARDEMRERLFARLDTDRNGAISKEEFKARPAAGQFDRKGDARRGDARGHRMAGADKHHRGARRGNEPITRTAFVDAGLSRFDRTDTDRDGKISSAERDAARKAMRNRPAPTRPSPLPPGQ